MNKLQKYAPRRPSRERVTADRGVYSPPLSATLDNAQMGADTALGRRWGLCRLAPVHCGQDAGLSDLRMTDLPVDLGRRLTRLSGPLFSIHFIRSGRHANAAVANTETSGNCRFQRFRQGHPSQFQTPCSVASELSDGAQGSVPNPSGEIPKHEGERHVVSRV